MALASGIGARIAMDGPAPHAKLFGEDQGRYLVAVAAADADAFVAAAEAAA